MEGSFSLYNISAATAAATATAASNSTQSRDDSQDYESDASHVSSSASSVFSASDHESSQSGLSSPEDNLEAFTTLGGDCGKVSGKSVDAVAESRNSRDCRSTATPAVCSKDVTKSAFVDSLLTCSCALISLIWGCKGSSLFGGGKMRRYGGIGDEIAGAELFADILFELKRETRALSWNLSPITSEDAFSCCPALLLPWFIKESLKRSRTSYCTLQVALYYLYRVRHVVQSTKNSAEDSGKSVFSCERKTFLAALILASKYIQDRNFSVKSWAKITGLSTQELNKNERQFLIAMDYNLSIPCEIYQKWSMMLLECTHSTHSAAVNTVGVESVKRGRSEVDCGYSLTNIASMVNKRSRVH